MGKRFRFKMNLKKYIMNNLIRYLPFIGLVFLLNLFNFLKFLIFTPSVPIDATGVLLRVKI